jgi:hypothetical protein
MTSVIGDPSVLLWVASAVIAFLGARTFVEYLRRLNYDGPARLWRELLLGSGALTCGLWAALVINISARGLPFEVGFHPLKVFGGLLSVFVVMVMLVAWVTYRPGWLAQLAVAALATLLAVILQVSVIWSIGAEPGLYWQTEPLSFAMLLMFIGFAGGGRMVVAPRRGSRGDRSSRRLMAALAIGACTVATQELVLLASGLDRQVVSAHARFLPEVAITLVAGAAVPIALVLMLVDQRAQQRVRAAERSRRRRQQREGGGNESMFSESLLAEIHADGNQRTQR